MTYCTKQEHTKQKGEKTMADIYRSFEVKEGKTWIETYRTENAADVYESLSQELLNKCVFKAPYYKKMTQHNNYDGTRTVIFYQDTGRSIYRIKAH